MSLPVLLIGNKNYSSWSLRPWLLLRHFEVAFEERRLPLDTPEFQVEIARWSPARRVPVLIDGEERIWDSLAICETVNERWLAGAGWPRDGRARAQARAITCEMHSGFASLRTEMPMNVRREPRAVQLSTAAKADCARVFAIWGECLQRSGGPWLFGDFSIADTFYGPVAWRFRGYGLMVPEPAARLQHALLSHPGMVEWELAARAEVEHLPQDEL